MSEPDIIDGEVVPENHGVQTEDGVIVTETQQAPSAALVPTQQSSLVPSATPDQLVARMNLIEETMRKAMRPDVDFGVIPGTGTKPTLLKPGAEKLCVLFRYDPQTTYEERWDGDHLTVTAHCVIYAQVDGTRLGSGDAICSTREAKYAYRKQERTCPMCGKENIRKSKQQSGGWYCWVKTDGCGANFEEDDPRIVDQKVGRVDNPDLPDEYNTIIKMAKKRALIDAVLLASGASALFTQDLERAAAADTHDGPDGAASVAGGSSTRTRTEASPTGPVTARGVSGPQSPARDPVVLASEEDVVELRKCASGLTPAKIRLAFGAVSLGAVAEGPISAESLSEMLAAVPQAKVPELAQRLAGAAR